MKKENKNEGVLEYISPLSIQRNEDNPRIFFRPNEMEDLLYSISKLGIQVPISVYKKDTKYILIDGERRWKCALKLNLQRIPALVRSELPRLDNLLLMYNIHALREQWDLFTIAMKLPDIIDLLTKRNNEKPKLIDVSKYTGLTVTTINRCKALINLPEKYKVLVYKELELPKSKQKLTEDFFVEMEKGLSVVKRKIPDLVHNMDNVRDILIKKYRSGVIANLLDLRKISKITRADKFGITRTQIENALSDLFTDNSYSVNQAYEEYVQVYYQEYSVESRIEWLLDNIETIDIRNVEPNLKELLLELKSKIDYMLRSIK